ncbi:MAG: RNA-binding transcriptional accessory protein [Erysipelotrichaceae bacterium]|nr:RNA-binding transcriptional accessory protein [Erysipelotrichaceae bacterium]
MNEAIMQSLAEKLKVRPEQVQNTLAMLEEGSTVPFIARYRKEKTGGLDEEQILTISKEYEYEVKLKERKEAVLAAIEQQGKLTEEIRASVMACTKLSQVEDVYRPYVQKKKTRAAMAINKGLQPLADWMLALPKEGSLVNEAVKYVNDDVKNVQEAIQGAMDIIAEVVSDSAQLRWNFKDFIADTGVLHTTLKKNAVDENKVYEMYYDRSEKIRDLKDHRIMAIDRAEKEKVINVAFEYDEAKLVEEAFESIAAKHATVVDQELHLAAEDGCKRLLFPSVEREIRSELSERAQNQSIEIFSMNLEKLLLQPPLKGRVVLGFDPGFYNGCKLAVVDETGKMLTVDKIYPFSRKGEDVAVSKKKLLQMILKYKVKIIAIGNGTASRESEKLVAEVIQEANLTDVSYAIVSEAGASVWSAQEAAREEFPDMAVEERSAVSIARRLLDPLAELIKIDPKSIGVGQYQHDLPEKALNERLDEAIMMCVNRTGADLNTASIELLTHISGLNSGIAREIINYRNANGKFTNRQQLKKVKKLGDKTFEQCAGFLRISDGDEPLDQTSIHPESYATAKELMHLCGIQKLGQEDITFDKEKIKTLNVDAYTLQDIESAIRQPLRDYRDQFDGALLRSDVVDISNLHVGDELNGTVRNVVDFGAFVDIGLHEDGLVHITRMSMDKVNHPSEVVSVGDIVKVYVAEVDAERNRVQLSLLPLEDLNKRKQLQKENYKKQNHKKQNKPQRNEKPQKKEVSMEEATRRLLERFGR